MPGLWIGGCLLAGLAAGYLGWAYFEMVSLATRWMLRAGSQRPARRMLAGVQAAAGILAWISYAILPAAAIILLGAGSRRVRFFCLLAWYGGVFTGFGAYFRRPEQRLEAWVRRLGRLYPISDA